MKNFSEILIKFCISYLNLKEILQKFAEGKFNFENYVLFLKNLVESHRGKSELLKPAKHLSSN